MPLSVQDVRPLNQAALLQRLRDGGPATRTRLAHALGLSHSAVVNVAASLLEQGVLVEIAPPLPAMRRGRPATHLALNDEVCRVIGVHVGVGTVSAGLCDPAGRVHRHRATTFDVDRGAPRALAAAARVVKRLQRDAAAAGQRVLGIGVGVPGPVDAAARCNRLAINLGWTDVPFADRLEAASGLPTRVEHNVRAMALAEVRYGVGRGVDTLAFVYLRSGIGAGLMSDGRPWVGGTHGVTELGHLPVLDPGPTCVCGSHGCLEAVAAEPALRRELERIAAAHPRSVVATALRDGDAIARVLRVGLEQADADFVAMLARTIDYLATAGVSLVNLFNPRVIVVGGLLAEAADVFLPPLRSALARRSFPLLREQLRIEPSALGKDVGVIGAATVALERFFYSPQAWRERVPPAA